MGHLHFKKTNSLPLERSIGPDQRIGFMFRVVSRPSTIGSLTTGLEAPQEVQGTDRALLEFQSDSLMGNPLRPLLFVLSLPPSPLGNLIWCEPTGVQSIGGRLIISQLNDGTPSISRAI